MKLTLCGIYRHIAKKTVTGTGDHPFEGPEVGRGQIAILNHGSVTNETTKNKLLKIGIKKQNEEIVYSKVRQASAIHSIWVNGRLILFEGDRAYALVVSPTASDVVHCQFHGLIYTIE